MLEGDERLDALRLRRREVVAQPAELGARGLERDVIADDHPSLLEAHPLEQRVGEHRGWFSEIPTVKAAEAVDGSASASAQAARSVKRERIAEPG